MKITDDNIKALLFSQGLPEEAAAEWLDYYEEATQKGKRKEEATAYAWEKLKKKWQKADNGKWVKLEYSDWANDLLSSTSPIIEVFRAGEYPQGALTIEDIEAMVQNYNPGIFEAPTTIDHVQDGPAFGWVRSIFRQGDRLFAVLRDLKDKFKELVKKGEYRYRSIEVFELEYKGKRVWPYLKAVSFLGAKAPQVKGMAEPVFLSNNALCYSMDDKSLIGFPVDVTEDSIRIRQKNPGDFQPNSFRTITLKGVNGVKAVIGKLKGKSTTEIQTYIFDKKTWTLEKAKAWVKEHRGKLSMEDLNALYNGGKETMELTQEQLDARLKEARAAGKAEAEKDLRSSKEFEDLTKRAETAEAENKRLKTDLSDKDKVNARNYAVTQFERLQEAGKLLPAEKEFFLSFMETLSPDKAEIEFSSEIKGTPMQGFVAFLDKLKPRVDLKQRTGNKDDDDKQRSSKHKRTYANADELSLKRQEYLDENLPAALKEAGDPKAGTPEYKRVFSAVYADAKEEIKE